MRFFNKITINTLIILLFAFMIASPMDIQAKEEGGSQDHTKLANSIREVSRSLEDNVGRLIIAKDQREMNQTIRERVDTFKNVVDLSISETNRLMDIVSSSDIDDLSSDNDDVNAWKNKKNEALEMILDKLNEEKEMISNKEGNIRLEEIQQIAIDFSNWRRDNYLPIKEQIETLDLIFKVQDIMNVTEERWTKIEADLSIIQQIGVIDDDSELWSILEQAKTLIEQGITKNENALTLFISNIKEIDNEENASETSLMSLDVENIDSSSIEDDRVEIQPDMEQESIRDLVGSSLQNVRDVYRSFIEMSDFVRELLASTSER